MDRQAFNREHGIHATGSIARVSINIDCLTDSDLDVACEHPALHNDVRAYALATRSARQYRHAGEVFKAGSCERMADRIYNEMPADLRW
jgi:hypothetical protein